MVIIRSEMIKSNFAQLRRQKSVDVGQDLTLRDIAGATGLAVGTVHRVSSGNVEGVRLSTIDALCAYFGVSSVSDLIEYSAAK